MLHDLLDDPAVVGTLDEVSDALRADVRAMDSPEALAMSDCRRTGRVVLGAGVATARAMLEKGVEPTAVAGLSVGAFAAAVVAGVLLLRDGVELVRLRAQEMERLFRSGYGLSAIVGLTESQVTEIVQRETTDQCPVFVGNINAPRQIVIAGANIAMERVLAEARRQGASNTVRLLVSVLSHCPLLQPVAEALATRVAGMSLKSPQAKASLSSRECGERPGVAEQRAHCG